MVIHSIVMLDTWHGTPVEKFLLDTASGAVFLRYRRYVALGSAARRGAKGCWRLRMSRGHDDEAVAVVR